MRSDEFLCNDAWRTLLRASFARLGAVVLAAFVVATGVACPAEAHWLTKLAREAGELGSGAARHAAHGLDNLGGLTRHLKALPDDGKAIALGAHATPEGHWKFVNRDGEVFTAASKDEMARVTRSLAPDEVAAGRSGLDLYLTEDTAFARRDALGDLPTGARLHVATGQGTYRLLPEPGGANGGFVAQLRPDLLVRLTTRDLFDEALWQLGRPLRRSEIRVVSLQPGGAQTLTPSPRLDPASKAALVDRVDPWKLAASLRSVRGQTVVVTGRIDGRYLHFKPESGAERSLLIDDLRTAAQASDVNLVVLDAASPRQPGGRNWFWRRIEIEGLKSALERAQFSDFVVTLGAGRGPLVVTAERGAAGRTRLQIVATGQERGVVSSIFGDWTDDIVSEVVGNVATRVIDVDLVDKGRQDELDLRLIPGVPFTVQALYIMGLVLGLAGLGLTRRWWRALWPPERREEYAGAAGYHAARFVRGLLFALIFLPVVGIPAGTWTIVAGALQQLWWVVTAPFRFVIWLIGRLSPAR
ncbi:MAG: hypothetical protein AB7E80_01000 [Hyphomicrobiaceae bacterium]